MEMSEGYRQKVLKIQVRYSYDRLSPGGSVGVILGGSIGQLMGRTYVIHKKMDYRERQTVKQCNSFLKSLYSSFHSVKHGRKGTDLIRNSKNLVKNKLILVFFD